MLRSSGGSGYAGSGVPSMLYVERKKGVMDNDGRRRGRARGRLGVSVRAVPSVGVGVVVRVRAQRMTNKKIPP